MIESMAFSWTRVIVIVSISVSASATGGNEVQSGGSGECVCLGFPSLGASAFSAAIEPVSAMRSINKNKTKTTI
jgi:hypothetical protein